MIKDFLPERNKNSHKGNYGKVLNIAGCEKYKGAAYFSSVAALKAGAGLVTLVSEEKVISNLFMPDVITVNIGENFTKENFYKIGKHIEECDVISAGSGFREDKNGEEFFDELFQKLKKTEKTTIFDAGALNIISKKNDVKLWNKAIITPHPGEASRLLKTDVGNINSNREQSARTLCERYGCIVVLKGHNTVICDTNGNVKTNTTGNSALAKGGTGDVLTGMIAGLCAQSKNLFANCVAGVYLHGLAGELASKELTEYCTNASDLLNYIPEAFKGVLNSTEIRGRF